MTKEHSVIFIPGLSDHITFQNRIFSLWQKHGLQPILHSVDWRDGEQQFQPKLDELLQRIDQLAANEKKISIVGISAGGSAALNAFIERQDIIHRIVTVCARLRTGTATGLRSFHSRTKKRPAFATAVQRAEVNTIRLEDQERQRIMTVRARFGDELVPADTAILAGAHNTTVPTSEHVLSITAALTVFALPLITFLQQDAYADVNLLHE